MITYGVQHTMKEPTEISNVVAAFVSHNRCIRSVRRTDLRRIPSKLAPKDLFLLLTGSCLSCEASKFGT